MTDFQLAALNKAAEHLDLAAGSLSAAIAPENAFIAGLLETVKILQNSCQSVIAKESAVRQASEDALKMFKGYPSFCPPDR